MSMTFQPGSCYEVTFTDGSSVVFRYFGPNSTGQQTIEVPPGSGDRDAFESLVPGAYRSIDEVDCPD
jgi:hypothetical protein